MEDRVKSAVTCATPPGRTALKGYAMPSFSGVGSFVALSYSVRRGLQCCASFRSLTPHMAGHIHANRVPKLAQSSFSATIVANTAKLGDAS